VVVERLVGLDEAASVDVIDDTSDGFLSSGRLVLVPSTKIEVLNEMLVDEIGVMFQVFF
jgi:hypothetical protein